FRDGLNRPAAFFDPEVVAEKEADSFPLFRGKVRTALLDVLNRELQKQGTVRTGDGAAASPGRAIGALSESRCVPFLGSGIYGAGPLSTGELMQALGPTDSLASAAEYNERKKLTRDAFLRSLGEMLTAQAARAAPPPVFDLLLRHRPPLIVSATCDLYLEEYL